MALTFLTWFKGVYFYISQAKSCEPSEQSPSKTQPTIARLVKQ
ncbi:protein of unknown function [Paraburkholderia kururiensis]